MIKNYDEFFESLTPVFYDEQESRDEAAAQHQMQMDLLYRLGCQYNIAQADMAAICQLANININELMNYSGTKHEEVEINGLTKQETDNSMSVRGLSKKDPPYVRKNFNDWRTA